MRNHFNMRRLLSAALTASIVLFAGCTTSNPTIDTSPGAEVTFDGLREVKGGNADKAWARPDADFTHYSKIMLLSAGIEYRPGGESGRTMRSRSQGGPYEVTEAQKTRIEKVVREAFTEELANSEHFRIVSEPGPDVLLVRGALLDVVSYVPPEQIGRGEIYLSRVGEATLVVELRDSITEAILARAIDRRAAERVGQFSESNRVTNRSEIRQLAKRWGSLLRDRLDELAGPKK